MKIWKQLLRQPLKTLVGFCLMTLAAAIVCVCVGQALAALNTKETLNERFSTVAIPLVQEHEGYDDYTFVQTTADMLKLDPGLKAWLEEMAQKHPDIVQGISQQGLLSAYIPEMTPLSITSGKYEDWCDSFIKIQTGPNSYYESTLYMNFKVMPYSRPQTCAMLVITLEEIDQDPINFYERLICDPNALEYEDFPNGGYFEYWETLEKIDVSYGYSYKLVGTVTQAISVPDDCRDPVGMVARLELNVQTIEEFEALNLEVGQQYVVYGMDYMNEHWLLGAQDKFDVLGETFYNYDPSLLKILTEEERAEYRAPVVALYDHVKLMDYEFEQLNAISMTLEGPISRIEYDHIRDENGYLLDVAERTAVSFTNAEGETVTIPNEQFREMYQIPTIAKLEGSVEEFLSAEEGALWREALARDEINHHAFAVMGVDRMNYLATFALTYSRIVEGRDFTAEELENGSRVCIISEKVAQLSGLKVGDTIHLSMYTTDFGLPYQQNTTDDKGILDPQASFYFDTTPFADSGEYTIVGLWRGQRAWADLTEDVYAFSANTVFVPQSSVQTTMETNDSILFNTVIIENGALEAFKELLIEAGFAGRFRCYDQGYSEIAVNFHNYAELGKQVLVIGGVIYLVMLLLFLLLYPGAQRKNVRIMQSFGARFPRRVGFILASSMSIVVPASVLGGVLGLKLWDRMVLALQASAESAIALELQPVVIVYIALAQLAAVLLLTLIVSMAVAAPKGISARR